MKLQRSREKYLFADLWYAVRKKFGFPAVSETRMLRMRRLSPGTDAAALLRKEDDARIKKGLLCLLCGTLLAVFSGIFAGQSFYTELARPGYGEEEEERILKAEYRGQAYDIPVTVTGRHYSEAEWEVLKKEAYENVTGAALGENSSWRHITGELDLSEDTGIPGITAEWDSSDQEVISSIGTLPEMPEEQLPKETALFVTLSHEEWSWKTKIIAVRCPADRSPEERIVKTIAGLVEDAAKDREAEKIALPETADGERIRYYAEDSVSPALIIALSAAAAFCVMYLPAQRQNEKIREREASLLRSYPEIASTLAVLMGAGMTVRSAWRKMVQGYEQLCLAGMERREAYEEMAYAVRALDKGAREEDVYSEFGRRCGLTPYLRLAGLLSSNIKLGNAGLLPLLQAEAAQALEERMRNARKYGEEASSKLLAPMMLLLTVVLVLLTAPAFMSM